VKNSLQALQEGAQKAATRASDLRDGVMEAADFERFKKQLNEVIELELTEET
jgi:hypothetical protein